LPPDATALDNICAQMASCGQFEPKQSAQDDLASALAREQLKQKEARYRNAHGDTWNGEGEMPQWLKQAISAGQSIEHFELSSKPVLTRSSRESVDWRNDPFAGSRLARQDTH
jgi:DNA-binding protein H-NS